MGVAVEAQAVEDVDVAAAALLGLQRAGQGRVQRRRDGDEQQLDPLDVQEGGGSTAPTGGCRSAPGEVGGQLGTASRRQADVPRGGGLGLRALTIRRASAVTLSSRWTGPAPRGGQQVGELGVAVPAQQRVDALPTGRAGGWWRVPRVAVS